jgi:AcrR family transcriptional regulator
MDGGTPIAAESDRDEIVDMRSERPERRTQAERRATSEARMLRAAAELIAEKGIQRTSLAQIGERAGYSHAMVNHRFGSKDALVERLNDAADAFYAERAIPALADRDGFEALAAVIGLYLDLTASDDPIARVHLVLWAEAFGSATDLQPSRARWDAHFREGIATLVSRGIADGSIRSDVNPTDAALAVVALLRGITMEMSLDPTCRPVGGSADLVVGMVRAALTAGPGA